MLVSQSPHRLWFSLPDASRGSGQPVSADVRQWFRCSDRHSRRRPDRLVPIGTTHSAWFDCVIARYDRQQDAHPDVLSRFNHKCRTTVPQHGRYVRIRYLCLDKPGGCTFEVR
jgi:hypothetical protein